MINKNSKIYIAGHKGMVGSACLDMFRENGYDNFLLATSSELDLRDQKGVFSFIENEKPDLIINAAAKVGGILANNSEPFSFLMDNMLIQNNIIGAAQKFDVKKLIFLGSSCIYPKFADQPIKEEYLLTGDLEPTNQWYAIAKISGVKLIESIRNQFGRDYISLMPTNLYGPRDNFNPQTSHVIPGLIYKFNKAIELGSKEVVLWGNGEPLREFMHVNDLASAVFFASTKKIDKHILNVGSGEEISIYKLAALIKELTGFKGEITWDTSKPNGTPRKLMDSTLINNLGWNKKIDLNDGLIETIKWFVDNK